MAVKADNPCNLLHAPMPTATSENMNPTSSNSAPAARLNNLAKTPVGEAARRLLEKPKGDRSSLLFIAVLVSGKKRPAQRGTGRAGGAVAARLRRGRGEVERLSDEVNISE